MSREVKLITNFHDYYDHHFDGSGVPFLRKHDMGMNRPQMLDYMSSKGIKTVPYGYLHEMAKKYPLYTEVVVYTDISKHQGEGKVRMSLIEALETYPIDTLCTLLCGNLGESWRVLNVGRRKTILDYHSKVDWRSNVGDVEVTVVDCWSRMSSFEGILDPYEFPLVAIDYVKDGNELLAVDLNVAPQLKGTGMEDLVTPEKVVNEMKKYIGRGAMKHGIR
ncbi:hypothetical protein [Bacillus cereus group sp. BfR-BA-01328]|uniref:hypothetical protein n=1 Tax=Bacillus cereus group sp. BfR-BA-01328 TaxID=2920304 RepID=UPI001F5732CD